MWIVDVHGLFGGRIVPSLSICPNSSLGAEGLSGKGLHWYAVILGTFSDIVTMQLGTSVVQLLKKGIRPKWKKMVLGALSG